MIFHSTRHRSETLLSRSGSRSGAPLAIVISRRRSSRGAIRRRLLVVLLAGWVRRRLIVAGLLIPLVLLAVIIPPRSSRRLLVPRVVISGRSRSRRSWGCPISGLRISVTALVVPGVLLGSVLGGGSVVRGWGGGRVAAVGGGTARGPVPTLRTPPLTARRTRAITAAPVVVIAPGRGAFLLQKKQIRQGE